MNLTARTSSSSVRLRSFAIPEKGDPNSGMTILLSLFVIYRQTLLLVDGLFISLSVQLMFISIFNNLNSVSLKGIFLALYLSISQIA
jgi:hypothetical protein